MKILLIGSGGREHSLALALSKSRHHVELFIAPGNPGTSQLGKNIPIQVDQINELLAFAQQEAIDLTVVGPELPLALGIVDQFQAHHLKIIGPTADGARIESSKAWAKAFYKRHHIPSAAFEIFTDFDAALTYLRSRNTYPIVLKADGLAAGKGVTVAQHFDEAKFALEDCFIKNVFANAGKTVVIEDFLKGQEASVLAFTDGKTVIPMVAAQDHKAIFDNDQGPNTGGMGAYAPAPIVTPDVAKRVYDDILLPVVAGFQKENISYQGILYAGLMIDNGIPSVVEFNARFGDPETQVVLPLLNTDLVDIFIAITEQKLGSIQLEWKDQSAVCVVLAAQGYPGPYVTKVPIQLDLSSHPNVQVIHAGTAFDQNGQLVTNGGRVFGVVGIDSELNIAQTKAYDAIKQIHFSNQYFRKDIAQKALTAHIG